VAQVLRWKPARDLGLAFGEAGRERMSEAGPVAAKSGYQWRPGSRVPSASAGRSEGTCRRKAPSACEWCAVLVDGTEAGRGTQEPSSGCRARGGGATGGAREPAHRARVGPTKPARAQLGTPSHSTGRWSWQRLEARHQPRHHPGPEMPATAIRRRRGQWRVEARAKVRGEARGRSRRSERWEPEAWE